MPYVSESKSSPNRVFDVRFQGTNNYLSLPDGAQKSQIGFRSGPLSPAEEEGISPRPVAGNIMALLHHYDGVAETNRDVVARARAARYWPVHDRDYTVTRFNPKGFSGAVKWYGITDESTFQGAFGITGLYPGWFPAKPTDAILQAKAAKMMRNSVPSEQRFDLARFIGEIKRDGPAMLRAANWHSLRNPATLWRSPLEKARDVSGDYLAWQFGVKPTGQDLGNLAAAIVAADKPIRGLINQEKVQTRTSKRETLWEDSDGGTVSSQNAQYFKWDGSTTIGRLNIKCGKLVPCSSTSGYCASIAPILRWNVMGSQRLRQFSTWEMFVPRPMELESRLDHVKAKAEEILGMTKVTEDTVWELTPWTWLSDWFIDVGGLIRYQAAVRDNQIVALANGYSLWEEYTGSVTFAGYKYTYNPLKYRLEGQRVPVTTATIRWRRHTRRSGSPYSIMPTWTGLSSQQWAILTALGIARSPEMPHIRM